MPNYAFTCNKCRKDFDLFLKIADRDKVSAERTCPFCASQDIIRLITPNAGLLKGQSSNSCGASEFCGNNTRCCASGQCGCK